MRNPMDGGEVAYLRHAEVGVEENPGTLRCALHTGLRKSAVALRREGANRGMAFIQPLFGGFFASRRWGNPMVGGRWARQPPKDGCIIVAPGWLAYLGLVVERKK